MFMCIIGYSNFHRNNLIVTHENVEFDWFYFIMYEDNLNIFNIHYENHITKQIQ